MEHNAPRGQESPERFEEPLSDTRVTARIIREADGSTHHEYHADGRSYGSLTALKAAEGGIQ